MDGHYPGSPPKALEQLVLAASAMVVSALEAKFPQAAVHLDEARDDILAFTAFPREVWRQIWSNNPIVIWSPKGGRGCDLGCFVEDNVLDEAM
jgi:putative transposase